MPQVQAARIHQRRGAAIGIPNGCRMAPRSCDWSNDQNLWMVLGR